MKLFIIFILTVLILITVSSCDQNDYQEHELSAVLGHPSDYFPTKIGTTWEYDIIVTKEEALNYREVSWPLENDKVMGTAIRGLFMGQITNKEKSIFKLVIRIVGKPKKQAVFQYENARQLEVIIDELGIFEDVKKLFWIITPGRDYQVSEVRTYDPNTSGSLRNSWGGWNQTDGYAHRLYFFGAKPGTSIGISGSPDKLIFLNVENEEIHFRRVVDSGDGESKLNLSFQEDMWFAKGKGLIKLVQKIDGNITMIWKLKSIN